MQRPRLQMLHGHKPIQPRVLRIAGLIAVLHHIPEAHPLPARAVEKRECSPGGVGLQFGEGWKRSCHAKGVLHFRQRKEENSVCDLGEIAVNRVERNGLPDLRIENDEPVNQTGTACGRLRDNIKHGLTI